MAKAPVVVKRVKNATLYEGGYVKLMNVRVSYPHLDKPYAGEDGGEPKFGMVSMLNKKEHKDAIALVDSAIADLLKANKNAKVSKDKRCIRDGDDSDKEEYEGHFTLSARESKRPTVRDGDGVELDKDEINDVIYAGCYADVLIRLWYQDNKFGKRVNANLNAVKFRADGEPFGEGRVDDEEMWDDDDDNWGDSGSDDDDNI